MKAVKTTIGKKSTSQNVAPEYDDATQRKLLRFLAAYLTEAENTLEQTIKLAGEDRHLPIFANKIKYHKSQVSTIKWLVSRVYYRQRHLLELDDDQITEIVDRCVEQSQT